MRFPLMEPISYVDAPIDANSADEFLCRVTNRVMQSKEDIGEDWMPAYELIKAARRRTGGDWHKSSQWIALMANVNRSAEREKSA